MIYEEASPLDGYEKVFRPVFQLASDGILFVGPDLKIVEANHRVSAMHGIAHEKLAGMDCRELFILRDREILEQVFVNLGGDKSWIGKLAGLGSDGRSFSAEVTFKQMVIDEKTFFCMVVRDLSEHERLQAELRQEKACKREMYITLRNVLQSIETEKTGMERTIAYKIETILLPALDKVKREGSRDIRNTYIEIMRDQLIGLTKGFTKELDGRFLRLTRTELKICQFVQAGCSSKEIAEAMDISHETIQTHRKNIRRKLGLRDRKTNLYTFLSTKSELGRVHLDDVLGR